MHIKFPNKNKYGNRIIGTDVRINQFKINEKIIGKVVDVDNDWIYAQVDLNYLDLRWEDPDFDFEVISSKNVEKHFRNDNGMAINMLNCVSALMHGIEYDDVKSMDIAFESLKANVEAFEKVFHDNLVNDWYK